MNVVYTAIATTTGGGRDGLATTSDGKVRLQLAYPCELGGDGEGTNPEQLVALGYSACFGSALALVAKKHRIDPKHASTTCYARLQEEDGGFSLSFEIEVSLPDVDEVLASAIVAAAHELCPYSRAFGYGATTMARLRGE